jgi:uncharacterized membrane protein
MHTEGRMSEKGRVEAFSDGVFAIAITLLVLEIHVPDIEPGSSLWVALGHEWPSYFAYVVGFLVIGVMWLNHHTTFSYLAQVDRPLLQLNLLLLLAISAVPWPVELVARYLDRGSQASVAVAVLGLLMTAMSIAFTAFWQYATRHPGLLRDDVDVSSVMGGRVRFALGLVAYPALTGLAFVSAPVTLALHGVLALYYAFDQTAARRAKALAERA